MPSRREFVALSGFGALAGTAAAPSQALAAEIPAIRTLTHEEVAIEGGSVVFNEELAGRILDLVANDRHIYISLVRDIYYHDGNVRHVRPEFSIVRWPGGANPVELIYGMVPDQDQPWTLETNGQRVFAYSGEIAVVLG
jgi:hypothetical protein